MSVFKIYSYNMNNKYDNKEEYVYGLTAPRGRILDVNGNILVDNKQVKVIIANTYGLSEKDIIESVKLLKDIISIDYNISLDKLKYYYYINNKNYVDSLVCNEIITKYKERKISSKDLLEEKGNLF